MNLFGRSDSLTFVLNNRSNVKLDWPWIAEWTYAGIFDVTVRIQNQYQFWVSHQKNRGRFFNLFEKSKNELVRQKTMFLTILAKNRSFFNNSNM